MMDNKVDKLITILEDLYKKQHKVDEIALSLQGITEGLPSGPGFMCETIYVLESIIVELLGGNDKNFQYCKEIKIEEDPFHNLEYGNISRSEFLKQVRRIIELNLVPRSLFNR